MNRAQEIAIDIDSEDDFDADIAEELLSVLTEREHENVGAEEETLRELETPFESSANSSESSSIPSLSEDEANSDSDASCVCLNSDAETPEPPAAAEDEAVPPRCSCLCSCLLFQEVTFAIL